MTDADPRPPLFILSFRQRDELADAAARAGWRAVAARRADGAERRFAISGASVAVIDARGALEEGLAATRLLGPGIARQGAALLVLVSRGDASALTQFHDAGATQFLSSPMREAELVAGLRFAARHAERAGGELLAVPSFAEPLGWRYDPVRRSLQTTPALARAVGMREGAGAARLLARLDQEDRPAFRAALGRVASAGQTAFAHDVPGLGRVVQHLARDPRSGRLQSLIEPIGPAPDPGAALRDAMPRPRSTAALARDLPRAMAEGEIEILFQPQVDIPSDAITGVEALARWRHGRFGEVGAEALLAAAARAGRAVELSDHLQARALALAAAWPPGLSGLRLSINITAADVAAEAFEARLLARIDASGFPRARLTLEITESELIADLDAASASLVRLRAAGVRVAIDDFGTGYSSLAYLNALPVDYLKLDRRLTQDITGSTRDRVVVRGVIAIARSLGMRVIAEGVETEAQRALIAAEACDLYQGYLCAPPLDAEALGALVGAQT